MTEMCQNNLDKLLHAHMMLYNQIFEERRRLERVCYLNRKLLQPWACKETPDDSKSLISPQTRTTTPNNTDLAVSVESLKIEDHEEVDLVNKLLAKAIKARASVQESDEDDKTTHGATSEKKDMKRSFSNLKASKSAQISKEPQCSDNKASITTNKPSSIHDTKHGRSSRPASSRETKCPRSVKPPYRTDPVNLRGRKTVTKTQKNRRDDRQGHTIHSDVIVTGCSGDGQKVSETVCFEPSVSKNVQVASNCVINKDINDQHNQLSEDSQTKEAATTLQPNSDDRFCLLRDGSKLTVPSQLRKWLAQNAQLKEKLNTHRLTAKVDQVSHKDNFLQRLIELEDVDKKVELAAKVRTQTLIHEKLLTELSNLQSNPVTAKDILRKRMVLEMILQSYEECGKEVSVILKHDLKEDLVSSIQPAHVILPQLVKRLDNILELKSMDTDGCLEYHSEKQLLRYVRGNQSQTLLNVQKIITTGVIEDLLPELQGASKPNSQCVVPLYRAVYSLLSSPGHQLPTVLRDTTELSDE